MNASIENKDIALQRNHEKLGIAAASICFLIGWWHTGKGLAYFKILDSENGGFLFATFVLIVLIISYSKAVRGSGMGLAMYAIFALLNFVCNLNSFYPNYRADALIRQELREHRSAFTDLQVGINKAFSNPSMDAYKTATEAKITALKEQAEKYGCGPKCDSQLRELEKDLDLEQNSIKTLPSRSREDDKTNAVKYEDGLLKYLDAKLKRNRYYAKVNIRNKADEYLAEFNFAIEKILGDSVKIKVWPTMIEKIIKAYTETCKDAVALVDESTKFSCLPDYGTKNKELGTFSHTFSSITSTIGDGGTLAVLAITVFLDFVCPMAIFLLLRRKASNGMTRAGWILGGMPKKSDYEMSPLRS